MPETDAARPGTAVKGGGQASAGRPPPSPDAQDVWRAVLASALDCIIVMDTEGLVREFNPAASRTFGYLPEQAIGRPLAELIIPPELRPLHNAGLRRYLETGQGPVLHRRIEIEAVRSDGSRLPVELAIVPFESQGERLFAGYLRDLSDLVRARAQIERQTALGRLLLTVPLAASEATSIEEAVAAALEHVCRFTGWPVGHALFLDDDGQALRSRGTWRVPDPDRFRGFMEATHALPFHRGEGLPGRVWVAGKPIWIADAGQDSAMLRANALRGAGLGAAFAFPVLVDGQVRLVLEFFAEHAREPDESLLQAMALVGSEMGRVLQRLQTAQSLREANDELQRLTAAQQRFLSVAAHELGTPLTALRLQLSLLERVAGQNAAKHVQVIDRNLKRLQAMARDLSDAGRIGSGSLPVRLGEADLRRIVEESVASAEPAAHAKGVQLKAHAGDVKGRLDRERMGQVLDNLLANAIRFTPPGGTVTVTLEAQDGHAVVTVADTGYGIEPSALPRMFKPFSQVHGASAGKVGGSGLGLFISQGIARAHGGELSVHSPGRGKGSAFTLRVPLAPPAPPAPQSAQASPSAGQHASPIATLQPPAPLSPVQGPGPAPAAASHPAGTASGSAAVPKPPATAPASDGPAQPPREP